MATNSVYIFLFDVNFDKSNPSPYAQDVFNFSYTNYRVFWLNIAKFKVNWCYRYCFKLFSNLRKEKELRQYHCRNSTKVGERKIKSRREKFFIFDNSIATIPSAHSATGWVLEMWVRARKIKWVKKMLRNLWKSIKKSCHVHNIFTTFSQ